MPLVHIAPPPSEWNILLSVQIRIHAKIQFMVQIQGSPPCQGPSRNPSLKCPELGQRPGQKHDLVRVETHAELGFEIYVERPSTPSPVTAWDDLEESEGGPGQ